MNSPFALLFLSIQARIKAILDTDFNPLFRFIDQDLGQLEYHNGDGRAPVSYPCCLIDIANTPFNELGGNNQTGMATVIIRIAFPPFSSTSNLAPAEFQEKALRYYEIEQALHKALHCWVPDIPEPPTETSGTINFGALTRVSASTEERSDFIRVRVIPYTIGIEDYSTTSGPSLTPITDITLNLTTEFTT